MIVDLGRDAGRPDLFVHYVVCASYAAATLDVCLHDIIRKIDREVIVWLSPVFCYPVFTVSRVLHLETDNDKSDAHNVCEDKK